MKKIIFCSICAVGLALLLSGCGATKTDDVTVIKNNSKNMKIISQAFDNEASIPAKYTCDGLGINPPFVISGVPENTVSLALVAWDPDVPHAIRTDGNWDHWVVFNINPSTQQINEGQEPDGVHGITTSNTHAYVPPCPPDGQHRYFFKVYALDTTLDLSEDATRADVEQALTGHVLDEAQIMGVYCREGNC